jgi:hypothetical protein
MSGMSEQQERALIAGLKALAATTRTASAGAGVEEAVLGEMRRRVKPAPTSRAWLPVAAALILATSSGVWLAQRSGAGPRTQIDLTGFMEVPGAADLPPMESGTIVRVALPVTALPSYGIQLVPDFDTYSVVADLLVAQDGMTRGIRFVTDSDTSRSTP